MVLEISNFTESSTVETVLRSIFLGFPAFAGFILNAILIVLVSQSNCIRGIPINRLVISLTVSNLVDALFNISIQLSTSITSTWDFGGDYLCRANSSLMQLIDTYLLFNLVLIAADRLIAVKFARSYERVLNLARVLLVLLLTATLAVCIALPVVLVPEIPAYLYPSRYSCSFGYNSTPIYVLFALVLCYVLPILLLIVLYSWIFRLLLLTRRTHHLANSDPNARAARHRAHRTHHRRHRHHRHHRHQHSHPRYVTRGMEHSAIWVQLHGAKYSGILTIFWCLLVLPYLSYVYFERLLHSFQVGLDIHHYAELALVTARGWYVLVLPILTFVWRQDFNLRLRSLCCCCCCCMKDVDDTDPSFWPSHERGALRHHRLRSRERDKRRGRGGERDANDSRGVDAVGVGVGTDAEGGGHGVGLTSPGATSSDNEVGQSPDGTVNQLPGSASTFSLGAASGAVGSPSSAPNSVAARGFGGGVGPGIGSSVTVSTISLNVPVLFANEEGIHLKTCITMPSSSAGRAHGQTQLSSLNAQLLNNLDNDHQQGTVHSHHSGGHPGNGNGVVRTRVSMKCDIGVKESESEDEDETDSASEEDDEYPEDGPEDERGPRGEEEDRGPLTAPEAGLQHVPAYSNPAFEDDSPVTASVLQTRALVMSGPHAVALSASSPLNAAASGTAARSHVVTGAGSPSGAPSPMFVQSQAIHVAPDTAHSHANSNSRSIARRQRHDRLFELPPSDTVGRSGDRRQRDATARSDTIVRVAEAEGSASTSVTTLELNSERSSASAAAAAAAPTSTSTTTTSISIAPVAGERGADSARRKQHSREHQHRRRRRHHKQLEADTSGNAPAAAEEAVLTARLASRAPETGRSETSVVIEATAGTGTAAAGGADGGATVPKEKLLRAKRTRERSRTDQRRANAAGPEADAIAVAEEQQSARPRHRSRSFRAHRRQRSSGDGEAVERAPPVEAGQTASTRAVAPATATAPAAGDARERLEQFAPLEHESTDGADAEPDELQASAGSNAPLRLHMQPAPLERPTRSTRAADAES